MDVDPRAKADKDLLNQLRQWWSKDKEIILVGNFNQNMYTLHFAGQLTADGIGLEEQYSKLHEEQAPFSYVRGTEPIMGCFATSDVFIRNYFMVSHGASGSVGDHRLHIVDFYALSILGVKLPAVIKRAGRRLQHKLKVTRRKYRRDLVKICKQHRMKDIAITISKRFNFLADAEHKAAREQFDKQHTELQVAMEKMYHKFKLGKTDYTPL